jgi:N-acyl-D-aspartate/D-glutamate deacylase
MFSSLFFFAVAVLPQAPVEADYVLTGATLIDGSGKPGVVGNLAIKGERIVGVGSFEVAGNPRRIDATGLIVAPGFIDLHTHSDTQITQPATRANLNYLMQGVTSIVTGNCGSGPVDVTAFLKKVDEHGAGSNVLHQVPHNAVRTKVMGNVNRRATPQELAQMRELVDRGMRDGAWGLSTGLIYTPGCYSDTAELIELAKAAAEHGGLYASHIRGEGTELLTSIHEILEIGRQANLPVHISHMKASGRKAWGKAADALGLVEQARANGQIVTADQYPYTASSTSLAATVIPTRYREGKHEELVARFDDPEHGPRLRRAIADALASSDNGKAIRIAGFDKRPEWNGKDLATIASQEKKSVLDVAVDIERNGGAGVVHFSMNDEDMRLIMAKPFVATASDGSARVPSTSVPHPRSYGCFPRKIGLYALKEKVVTLEHAIRSASGLPADILRLPERGYLRQGYFADVVVLDPRTLNDPATFDQPHQYATGVRYMFVNGVLTISDGKYTGALAGRALRHPHK